MRSGHTSSKAITTLPATSWEVSKGKRGSTEGPKGLSMATFHHPSLWALVHTVVLSARSFSMTSISWSFWSESKLREKLFRGICPAPHLPKLRSPPSFNPILREV